MSKVINNTPPSHRECKYCNEVKPLSEFCSHPSYKFGKTYQCKSCRSIENKEWHKNNPNYIKEWYKANKETHKKKVAQNTRDRIARQRLEMK
jgi:hypothetical protein